MLGLEARAKATLYKRAKKDPSRKAFFCSIEYFSGTPYPVFLYQNFERLGTKTSPTLWKSLVLKRKGFAISKNITLGEKYLFIKVDKGVQFRNHQNKEIGLWNINKPPHPPNFKSINLF